jgi:hypothetical protein
MEDFAYKVSEWNTLQTPIFATLDSRDFTKPGGRGGYPPISAKINIDIF